MFGNNPVVKQDLSASVLMVNSMFLTIQGEGPFVGTPAIFVRMANCNLRCEFCDTDFSVKTHMSSAALLDKILSFKTKANLVVFTGGEPLLQPLQRVIKALMYTHDLRVQIETAGTVTAPYITELVQNGWPITIVVSPKTPKINSEIAEWAHAYKYIVYENMPFDFETGLPTNFPKPMHQTQEVFLQPMMAYEREGVVDEVLTGANTDYAVQLCLKYGHRLSIQTHKIIGVE